MFLLQGETIHALVLRGRRGFAVGLVRGSAGVRGGVEESNSVVAPAAALRPAAAR